MDKEYFPGLSRKRTARDKNAIEKLLVDWYGQKYGKNEILAHLPESESIKNGVEKALKKLVNKETAFLSKVKNRWLEIAGQQLAAYTKPSNFSRDTLYVEVSHSIWLMQLRNYNTDALIEKINHSTETDICRKIKFVPQGSYSTR
jgi:hypothetical protein